MKSSEELWWNAGHMSVSKPNNLYLGKAFRVMDGSHFGRLSTECFRLPELELLE